MSPFNIINHGPSSAADGERRAHSRSRGIPLAAAPLEILRCPATGAPLVEGSGCLQTVDGARTYPIVNGVPVLLATDLSIFSPEEAAAGAFVEKRVSYPRRLVRALSPDKTLAIGTADHYRRFLLETREVSQRVRPRILVVGGGRIGQGAEPLIEAEHIDLIETDVYLGPRVSVACDGHHLPFADSSFDGVVAQAVLEHVLDPQRVVSEIHRVLTDRGVVYAESPFLQPVHEGAFDFTRWTERGHRWLFRMFTEIDKGAVAGPGSTLLWALAYFIRSLPSRRSRRTILALDKVTAMMFFWLKYLDQTLIRHPAAIDSACAVYFLGRRSEEPTPPGDLLGGYSGVIGRPVRR